MMATVDITINNRIFKVTCDEGQEQRLQTLAYWADERLQMIAGEVGQIGDTRLMLLTLLMVSDELFELKESIRNADGTGDHNVSLEEQMNRETAAARLLNEAADKVSEIAKNVDKAI